MESKFLLEKFEGGMHYIMIDSKTVTSLTQNGNKRIICRLNDQIEFHCAILSRKGLGHFVYVGSSICRKLKLKPGLKITATFSVDDSPYQFHLPEELEEVLNTDPEAYTIFQSLTPGNQRGLMYLVEQVKSSDKKIERALKIASQLKKGITSPKLVLKKP